MTRNKKIIVVAIAVLLGFVAARELWPVSKTVPRNTVDIRIPLSYSKPLVIATFDFDFSIKPLAARAAAREEYKSDMTYTSYRTDKTDRTDRADKSDTAERFRYVDAYQNTDVVQTKTTSKLKEDIILKQPGHPVRFAYMIDDTGLDAAFDSEGNLHLYPLSTDMARTKFLIPAPYLIDATGEKSSTKDVLMTYEEGMLTLVPNPDWLAKHPYPITLDPTVEITVLNVNSVPTVGGPWEVRFTTVGTDTLTISGDPENTVYGVNVEPVSLRCGDEERMDQGDWGEQGKFIYKDWSCDEEAVWAVKVLLPGHHHQVFQFGDQTAEASNDTITNDWCGGLETFSYRRKVTLNNSSQASALTDFPASVQLTAIGDLNNVDYSKTQNSGQDVRFCDQDNATRLEYEIEHWDESATSTVWIKVPNITSASSTEHIWMYYGNISTTTAATTTGVWDDSFQAVYHLNETVNTGADGYQDSTKYNNDGTGVSMALTEVNGVAGRAQELDGTADYIRIDGTSALQPGTGPFTLEGWFQAPSANQDGVVACTAENAGDPEILTIGICGNDFCGATGQRLLGVYEHAYDTQAEIWFPNTSPFNDAADNQWHHAAISIASGSNGTMYYDTLLPSKTKNVGSPNVDNPTDDWRIGVCQYQSNNFDGYIDEVRLSTTDRSADWLDFTYCNIRGTCVSYGAEESQPFSITSVTDTPDPTNPNRSVAFISDWTGGSGSVKAKICKTDSLTSQNCDGGYWATSTAFTVRDPETLVYDIVSDDWGQTRNYYAFVCDSVGTCTSSSSGAFSVNAVSNVPDAKIRGGTIRGGTTVR